jgi:uncharacterized protein DUF1707
MATQPDWRAGDTDRETVAAHLREHYAAGRLTLGEFQARLDAAYRARTARELELITADLPGTGTGAGTLPPGARSANGFRRRRRRSRAGLPALLVFAAFVGAGVLIASSFPHGGVLVAAFLLLVVPVVLLTVLGAALIWMGRRAWRSGVWLEAVPVAVGLPWLGRVVWLARAFLVGRVFWRLGGRMRRPLRSRRAYAEYQDQPGGAWHQARVGDLSGTTR